MARNESVDLKKIELFSSLTDEELSSMSKRLVIKRFKKNDLILGEEDTHEYMYIILDGKVRVVQVTEDGKEILLAIHRAGELFGELSLIDGKTSPASVIAAADCVITLISKKDFYLTISTHKKVLYNLLQILCFRLRESWEKIQLLNLNNASERLKILFLMLSNKYGEKTSKGITLNIKLTHQEIAEMAGIARETVTRVIDKLHKEGKIDILDNRLISLSPHFLKAATENRMALMRTLVYRGGPLKLDSRIRCKIRQA
jgi:CRP/FNR family cyclic AMP-dependent transcriptional regulator